jgi:hypothetical protein
MARDDWRIRIAVEHEEHAMGLLDRLGLGVGVEARALASELEERRLAVSRDGAEIFVYAASRREAERAREVVQAELRESGIEATTTDVEHWLDEEDRWNSDPLEHDVEAETLARGYAPWEVRIACKSHADARDLADRLEAEGYGVERRWRYVIAGTASREQARELADRLHGEVEPGGELVWETVRGNPFAVFGGIGSAGTPL